MMTIGDFSRATRLSAKTLRFYHQVGLLAPARVDPGNGYRLYSTAQIGDAQVIRHFRSLGMPVQIIGEVLAADGVAKRNELIAGHLTRLEVQLDQTRAAVAGLQGLLAPAEAPLAVTHQSVPEMPALVIRDTIDLADLGDWCTGATRDLEQVLRTTAIVATGARGGLWSTELFVDERGPAALFVPVASLDDSGAPLGRARLELLPPVDLAVATHRGTGAPTTPSPRSTARWERTSPHTSWASTARSGRPTWRRLQTVSEPPRSAGRSSAPGTDPA
ncbi:MerR family transcriptional regulator [Cryobacterium lactosi]|nr:helix-turn-helix domain-containing protein [Cryobacterium lactosi]